MTPRENDGGRRKRDQEERALWDEVTRVLKPLRGRRAPLRAPALRSLRTAPSENARSVPPVGLPGALDRRQKKRLARGIVTIDARLDLHGKTQAQAHSSLLRFLRRAQTEGAKFVLVITGKGASRGDSPWEGEVAGGVLRRQVPLWLALPEFRAYASACEQADTAHGGDGALYIRIRRRRQDG
jgi:DNA-nicking Smr family endonuclease